MGENIKLTFLDAVLDLAACAVNLLVELAAVFIGACRDDDPLNRRRQLAGRSQSLKRRSKRDRSRGRSRQRGEQRGWNCISSPPRAGPSVDCLMPHLQGALLDAKQGLQLEAI